VHGGAYHDLLTRLGVSADALIDFSVNTNPYGPCAAVRTAVAQAAYDRYPDPHGEALRLRLAELTEVEPERLVIGNGAADLLWTLARCLVGRRTPVLVVEPTFCEFRAACALQTDTLLGWQAAPERDFRVDLSAVSAMITARRIEVVYLCSPNSPTGRYTPAAAVGELAREHPQVSIVLDEAFLSLSRFHADLAVTLPDNVVRVRSMTKDHAIPGLRIGYVLARTQLARQLQAHRPSWSINSLALAAAMAACDQSAFVAQSRERILADEAELRAALHGIGLSPVPSDTLFSLVPVNDAARLRERLLSHRILVRDCSSYGLHGFIRLCARPRSDVERLIDALKQELT
jgi:histidinol-phosphate/aromatic aminotransferase/cobyric acid decarboxylase-like protein